MNSAGVLNCASFWRHTHTHARTHAHTHTHTHARTHACTHTHPFNGHFSGTTQVSRYQKGKTNLDFTEARDSEWQWHQLGHMQVCTSLQTDNHTSTHHSVFYRPDALLPPNQKRQSTEGKLSEAVGQKFSHRPDNPATVGVVRWRHCGL